MSAMISQSAVRRNEQRDLRMARLPQLSLPSIPLHVIQRGNHLQPCYGDRTHPTHFGMMER